MKAGILGLLPLIALSCLMGGFGGCTADSAPAGFVSTRRDTVIFRDTVYRDSGVRVGDSADFSKLAYHEIRADAFSLFWLTFEVNADTVRGDTVISSTGFYPGTNILLDKSLDHIASLPAHVVDSLSSANSRAVFFPVAKAPGTFTCSFRSYGYVYSQDSAQGAIFSRSHDEQTDYYRALSETPSVTYVYCIYVPGKGFAFPDVYYGPYTGEFLVRY